MQKSTTERFVARAIEKHGNTYSYSNVVYVNNRIRVEIFCKACNESFWQVPKDHCKGAGCPRCGIQKIVRSKLKDDEKFVASSKKIYGDHFDYSRVEYKNAATKVELVCKQHNESFHQTPKAHFRGSMCPVCWSKLQSASHPDNTQRFIEKAKAKHGNSCDYSRVVYKGTSEKIELLCNGCGSVFWQTPGRHLSGSGKCPQCGLAQAVKKSALTRMLSGKKAAKNLTHTTDLFVEKAVRVHGNKFDYSSSVYINRQSLIEIGCNTCGKKFWQNTGNHLSGTGCPKCADAVLVVVDPKASGVVYCLTNKITGLHYVGVTIQPIKKRLDGHKRAAKRGNFPLAVAIREYGLEAFEVSVLEKTIAANLPAREKFWIERLNSQHPTGYNKGRAGFGIRFRS